MWALTADLLPYGIRRTRCAAALAILVAGAILAGCNSIVGGPTAAVLGGEAKRPAGQGGIDTRGTFAHRRRVWRHLSRRQGRADAGRRSSAASLPRPIGLTSLTASPSSTRRRSTPSRFPADISTSHAACWRLPTIRRKWRRCSRTRWATSPPITPSRARTRRAKR